MANKKILIVDDEPAFTAVVKLTLEVKENYEVCVENNPRNAVGTALKFLPQIIILDVVMPELDGGELLSQLQADPILRRIPVIFLTAIVVRNEVDQNQGFIGGWFYVAKPISADGLVGVIENRLRQQSRAPEQTNV
jgi:DNA-binding response OmpR family regulator